jgi:vacuolar-type H+-ATPase subunit I/STV1
MATKTYAEQINKAQVMLAGLKGNAGLLARRGLDEAFLNKLESAHGLAVAFNNEQEKLKSDLVTKTTQLDAKLAELAEQVSEAQKIVKMDFDQSRWKEFGIDAKR